MNVCMYVCIYENMYYYCSGTPIIIPPAEEKIVNQNKSYPRENGHLVRVHQSTETCPPLVPPTSGTVAQGEGACQRRDAWIRSCRETNKG